MDRAHELDTVELARAVDGWPAGTVGVVVSEGDSMALVEIVPDAPSGHDLMDEMVDVPYDALRVVKRAA
jgi:hypothetical protein